MKIQRSDWLIRLAGQDPDLLAKHLPNSCATEAIRLRQLGLTLFVPAVVGLFSFSYVMSKVFDDPFIVLACAVVYATAVFMIDRYFILSIRKIDSRRSLLAVASRLILAIAIGFVVSEPLIIKLFEDSINQQLAKQVDRERSGIDSELPKVRRELESNLRDRQDALSKLFAERARIRSDTSAFDEQIERLRIEGIALRTEKLAKVQEAVRAAEAAIKRIEADRASADQEIERLNGELAKERQGVRATKQEGKGPEYDRLLEEQNLVKQQRARDSNDLTVQRQRLTELERQLVEAQSDAVNPNQDDIDKLSEEKIARATNSVVNVDEVALKTMEGMIATVEKEVVELRKRIASVDEGVSATRGNITISDRDDLLASSKALWKLLTEADNALAWLIFAAFVVLFMVIDTLPLITKLTYRSTADDVTQRLEASDIDNLQEMLLMERLAKTHEFTAKVALASELVNVSTRMFSEIGRLQDECDRLLQKLEASSNAERAVAMQAVLELYRRAIRSILNHKSDGFSVMPQTEDPELSNPTLSS